MRESGKEKVVVRAKGLRVVVRELLLDRGKSGGASMVGKCGSE